MNKLVYVIVILGISFCSSAQDIIIDFQSKSAGTMVDSVWITNLNTNQKVKLLGNESLILAKTTGNQVLLTCDGNGYIYPNPCYDNANLYLLTTKNQNVTLSIYTIEGRLIGIKKQELLPGRHTFNLKFPYTGSYIVSVLKEDGALSYKVSCIDGKRSECRIDYEGEESVNQLKDALLSKTLSFTQGNVLHFSTYSSKNNTIVADSPLASKTYLVEFYECVDADKQNYPIVKIGKQWWMAKNLAYIPYVNPPNMCVSPIYYIYGYSGFDLNAAKKTLNYKTYGVLYNWYTAMNSLVDSSSSNKNPSGVQGLCPKNWHLPSDDEWNELTKYVSETKSPYVGRHLGTTFGWSNNGNGTDDFGFSALPGGYALDTFGGITIYGYWWTSTQESAQYSFCKWIAGASGSLINFKLYKHMGMSVRCVKD